MITLLLFLLLAGGVAAYTWWVYMRLELPVRHRGLLAGLRAASLLLLVLLLADVRTPWSGTDGGAERWVLLDVSASMSATDARGLDGWSGARARADELASEGWRIVTFGSEIGDSIPGTPAGTRSDLAAVLERAMESGTREVRVLSDLRFHDPVEIDAVLAGGATPVSFEAFGSVERSAGLADFSVADVSRAGDSARAELELFGEGVGDSVQVEFLEEGRIVARRSFQAPTAGLRRRVEVSLPPSDVEGRVRYTARVSVPGDGFSDDDVAVSYATTGYREGALVLISARPDWEPRYLLPVLTEVTGLESVGYLRVGPNRFATMGRAVDRGNAVDSATVRRAAGDAALLVVHGLSDGTDAWVASLTRRAPRLVAWPNDAVAAGLLGLTVSPPRDGEWYASQDLPASPLAADFAGIQTQGLPPLSAVHVQSGGGAGEGPLALQLGGTGPGEPALLLLQGDGRRTVVPMASGLWRWAARDGAGRDAYRRIWSGVAGWLLEADARLGGPEVRPRQRVFERDADIAWSLPDSGDIRLEIRRDSAIVRDTLLSLGNGRSGPLPAGSYAYEAFGPDGQGMGSGRFDVSASSLEMAAPSVQPTVPDVVARRLGAADRGSGRPLRTSPWPYLLILILLCAEWIGRRHVGLR